MTTTEAFGIREGEVTTELPAATDAGVYYIGRIRTPWTDRKQCPKNPREAGDTVCTVELDPRFQAALKDVETCTHLVLLYWMDKAPRNISVQVPHRHGTPRGTFALRSPARPNPLAMSVVKLIGIDGNRLSVAGVDCLDGTPLIDIKPYLPSVDSIPEAICGWRNNP